MYSSNQICDSTGENGVLPLYTSSLSIFLFPSYQEKDDPSPRTHPILAASTGPADRCVSILFWISSGSCRIGFGGGMAGGSAERSKSTASSEQGVLPSKRASTRVHCKWPSWKLQSATCLIERIKYSEELRDSLLPRSTCCRINGMQSVGS